MLDQRLSADEAIQQATERERERIARNLHDGVAQHIVHVLHKLELVGRLIEEEQPQQALAQVQRAYHLLETSLRSLRHDIHSLLPEQLERQDFTASLQALLHECQERHPGLSIDYVAQEWYLLPVRYQEPVFRLMQEALTNICRHAHATSIGIHLHLREDALLAEVSDNGIGFESVSSKGRMNGWQIGLLTMRTRVQEVGGRWEIESQPGQGTTVRAYFPREKSMP